MKSKKIIAITGFKDSGKTTICKALCQKHRVTFINPDEIVHKLFESNQEGSKLIKQYIGAKHLNPNGEVNRKRLRESIRKDPNVIFQLQDLIHPLVEKEVKKQIKNSRHITILLEIPPIKSNPLFKLADIIVQIKGPQKNDEISQLQILPEDIALTVDTLLKSDLEKLEELLK